MDPWTMAAIFAGVSAGKEMLIDAPNRRKQAQVEALRTKYSPITGRTGRDIAPSDPVGAAMQGGVMGFAQGQNIQDAQLKNQLLQSQTAANNAMAYKQLQGNVGNQIAMQNQAGMRGQLPMGNPWLSAGGVQA